MLSYARGRSTSMFGITSLFVVVYYDRKLLLKLVESISKIRSNQQVWLF